MKRYIGTFCIALVILAGASVSRAATLKTLAKAPYIGAIAIDADTGRVILEDHPDAAAYPASVVKLMNLFVVLDKIKAGQLKLTDVVTVTREAMAVGGTQVWLEAGETFTVEDLLYSMMIQSANDSATALAIHIAGTTDEYVRLMNQKANELGLRATIFHSVHGLPPSTPTALPDMTSPRDIANLSRALIAQHPEALTFTATRRRDFRAGSNRVDMVNHNHLLLDVPGCDGLKTGYYRKAGFSIAATVTRNGHRAIVVVMGSPTKNGRDSVAREVIARAMNILPTLQPPPPPPPPPKPVTAVVPPPPPPKSSVPVWIYALGGIVVVALIWGIGNIALRRPNSRDF